jgi:hypothetical protein
LPALVPSVRFVRHRIPVLGCETAEGVARMAFRVDWCWPGGQHSQGTFTAVDLGVSAMIGRSLAG